MKKNIKICVYALVLVVMLGSITSVNAQENTVTKEIVAYGLGDSIASTFQDPNMAQAIADQLSNGDTSHVLTETDLQTTYLNLSGKNIQDISGIGIFQNLTQLNIEGNQISTLPDELFHLPSLSYLTANNNNISQLPDSIGDCTLLNTLWIGNNPLSTLPSSMQNLNSLIYLELSSAEFTEIPSFLFNMTSIQHLKMQYNPLETVPAEIANMTGLKSFWIVGSNVTSLPDSIATLNLQNNTGILTQGSKLTNISPVIHAFLQEKGSAQTHPQYAMAEISETGFINQDFSFEGFDVYAQLPAYGTNLTFYLTTPSDDMELTAADFEITAENKVSINKRLLTEEGEYAFYAVGENGLYDGSFIEQVFQLETPADASLVIGEDKTIKEKEEINLLEGVSAIDFDETDITSKVQYDIVTAKSASMKSSAPVLSGYASLGMVNTSTLAPGTYTVMYSIVGTSGKAVTQSLTLTVEATNILKPTDPIDVTGGSTNVQNNIPTSDTTNLSIYISLLLIAGAILIKTYIGKNNI